MLLRNIRQTQDRQRRKRQPTSMRGRSEKNAYRFCYINDFPMSGTAQDLMYGAPSEITEQQLREVHIKVRD